MTKLRRDTQDISNYIDDLTDGIGDRGSSFRDVDRLTVVHDGKRGRWLYQSLKWRAEWEHMTDRERRSHDWNLSALACLPPFTALRVVVEPNGDLTVYNYRTNKEHRLLPAAYTDAFQRWWKGRQWPD